MSSFWLFGPLHRNPVSPFWLCPLQGIPWFTKARTIKTADYKDSLCRVLCRHTVTQLCLYVQKNSVRLKRLSWMQYPALRVKKITKQLLVILVFFAKWTVKHAHSEECLCQTGLRDGAEWCDDKWDFSLFLHTWLLEKKCHPGLKSHPEH